MDLLKMRNRKEKVDIDSLEKRYDIIFPPIFRTFIESFKWIPEMTVDKIYHYYPYLLGGEITFPFADIESNLQATKGSTDDDIVQRKLILFASSRYGIFVGTEDENLDKVLISTHSLDGDYKIIANNVFEFLRGVTDNLSDVAETVEEYRSFMEALGYEDEDLEYEIEDWKIYKQNRN